MNDVAVEGFAKKTGNPRFAYDSYRRFIQMYSDVVMEVPKSFFEKIIDELKEEKGVKFDTELTTDDLKVLVEKFKAVYKNAMNGEDFPQDPKDKDALNNLFVRTSTGEMSPIGQYLKLTKTCLLYTSDERLVVVCLHTQLHFRHVFQTEYVAARFRTYHDAAEQMCIRDRYTTMKH